MRIMEWAKELQEASEVSRRSLTRHLTSNMFYFYVIYVLVGVMLFKVNGGKSEASVCLCCSVVAFRAMSWVKCCAR